MWQGSRLDSEVNSGRQVLINGLGWGKLPIAVFACLSFCVSEILYGFPSPFEINSPAFIARK